MKKLNLKIEDLRIDSFQTDAAAEERGTVDAAQLSAASNCTICTRQQCYEPSEPGYGTFVNNICIRC